VRRQLVADAIRVGESSVAPVLLALLDQPVDLLPYQVEEHASARGVSRSSSRAALIAVRLSFRRPRSPAPQFRPPPSTNRSRAEGGFISRRLVVGPAVV
jgi:hypothetical protein